MSTTLPRLLLVDDEQPVLDGLRRILTEDFDVETADSGALALRVLQEHGPFAVVMSDMRMPKMDGAELLSSVRKVAPDTTRLLLTGQTDLQSAIRAVNDGAIFRFLCKPCDESQLRNALDAAVRQHELVTAERRLLEDTLAGAVNVLTELLSLVAPVAFSRAGRIRRLVVGMAKTLGVEDAWQYEVAALLCLTGFVALPHDVTEIIHAGGKLSPEQQRMVDAHPETAHRLLSGIPRLSKVAEMVRRQREPQPSIDGLDATSLGAALLRTAIMLDDLRSDGLAVGVALERMKRAQCPPTLLDIIRTFQADVVAQQVRVVRLSELEPQMILVDDVLAQNGTLLVPREREITRALIEKLLNFAQGAGVRQPIRVRLNT